MVSPLDTAWSILKELSREDLEMAARTGGVPRMSGTMRPEFSSGHPGHMAPMLGELTQPPAYDEGSEMMQEYNEAMFPDEEAEHRRINAPTPVRTPVMRRNRKTKERFMMPGPPMPVGEAGDASMPDPSQMEHLGAQLAHADMMRDDIDPAADVPFQVPPDFSNHFLSRPQTMHQSIFSRAPNRQAYMTRR